MALANDIQYHLMSFVKGGYDVVLPNFYYGNNECDLFRITSSDLVIEYEIKVSRSDYFADFKKENLEGLKHYMLETGKGLYCPNRFFYVTTKDLVSVSEVPRYAGLIYFDGVSHFDLKKNAPLIHKNKVRPEMYRQICHTLSNSALEQRKRIKKIRNTDFDKEMAAMKREVETLRKEKRDLSNQLWMRKHGHSETI
jgi:hypothetical protein